MARFCTSCGSPVAVEARFCGECGGRQPEPGSAPAAASGTPSASASTARASKPLFGRTGRVLYVLPDNLGTQQAGVRRAVEGAAPANRGTILEVSPSSAVQQVQAALREADQQGRLPSSVCLVGADGDLPHARLPDRAATQDTEVLTDNLFGMLQTPAEADRYRGDLLPDVPVSRLPTLDPSLLSRLLGVEKALPASWRGGLAVSADAWRGASVAVLGHICGESAPPLELSPPLEAVDIAQRMATRPQRLYFNVHGSDQTTDWYGDGGGRQPKVLQREDVRTAPGAIVTTEACYGAMQWPGEPSVSLTFLEQGASVFMGSTIIAWGPPVAPPGQADCMVMGFYEGLDQGMGVARAMLHAKEIYLERLLDRDEVLDPSEHNTLTSFLVYGPPMATVSGAGAKARPLPETRSQAPQAAPQRKGTGASALDRLRARRAGTGTSDLGTPGTGSSALDRLREQMRAGADHDSSVGQARRRLRDRMPPGSWELVSDARVSLSEIPAQLRNFDQLRGTVEDLLGGSPDGLRVVAYRSRSASRQFLMAWRRAEHVPAGVALVLDEHQRIVRRSVTR